VKNKMKQARQERPQDMDMTPITLCALTVGDAVAGALPGRAPAGHGQRQLAVAGSPRWHALRVAPMAEARVEAWLKARGVEAFHPVIVRQVRERGRLVRRERRYLPGYVFALFPGAPVVHAVQAHHDVYGAICRANGEWGVLDPCSLRAILSMRRVDARLDAVRRAELARVRAALRVKAGDVAMFQAGVFAGRTCEVVDLRADGGAVLRFKLFGGEVLISAEAGDLVPLRKTSASRG
jgi:transcription antitermination factor NusG